MQTDRVAQVFEAASGLDQQRDTVSLRNACRCAGQVGIKSVHADWLKTPGGFRLLLQDGLWLEYALQGVLYVERYYAPNKRKPNRKVVQRHPSHLASPTQLRDVLTSWGIQP